MENPNSSDINKTQKPSVIRWLGTIASLGLLIYLIAREWQATLNAVKHLDFYTLIGVILLTILSRICIWMRWHVLLQSGGAIIRPSESAKLFLAGLFSSNFLPTTIGGDLVRFAGLIRLKVPPAISAGSLVLDRLVGMAGMASLLPIGLVQFFSKPLPYMQSETLPDYKANVVSFVWLLSQIREYTRKAFDSIQQAIRLWSGQPLSLFISFLFTWAHMLLLILTLMTLFSHLDTPVHFWLVGGLWSISYFFTLLPVSINGFGLQELSMTFLFVNYAGVELNNVVVVAVAIRVLQTLISLPGAFFLPGLLKAKDMKNDEQESNGIL